MASVKLGFWINRKVAYLDERWSWPAPLHRRVSCLR